MATTHAYTQIPGFMPGPGPTYQSTAAAPQSGPRLAYFITRENGLPVPLIPVDELPFAVKLQNVPRVLAPQDTYGLKYIGTAPYLGATFRLECDPANIVQRPTSQAVNEPGHARTYSGTNVKQFLAPDVLARQAIGHNAAVPTSVLPRRPVSAAETSHSWRRPTTFHSAPAKDSTEPIDSAQAAIDAILRSESGAETASRIGYLPKDTTPPPSGNIIDQDKKIFCTHWIMTGDCKFVQQGCRYKHEMPSEAKLKELGIRHTPRWWLEMNAKVKLGGGLRAGVVGKVMKPEEWLNKQDSDSEDDATDDESDSGSDVTKKGQSSLSSQSSKGSKKDEVKDISKQTQTESPKLQAKVGSKMILQPNPTEKKSPIVPPTRPISPPSGSSIRKPSSTGSDLIDLTPIPSTTILTNSNKTTPIILAKSPDALAKPAISPSTKPAKTTTKVFVPAGESPEHHIAEMKKRERSKHSSARTSSPSKAKPAGLAKSTARTSERGSAVDTSPKRNRAGCRIRRPASAGTAGTPVGGKTATAAGEGEKKAPKNKD